LPEEGLPSIELVHSLKHLEAKAGRISGSETLANEKLLEKCLAAEERSRGAVDDGPCTNSRQEESAAQPA
jgi:hypothetical protein